MGISSSASGFRRRRGNVEFFSQISSEDQFAKLFDRKVNITDPVDETLFPRVLLKEKMFEGCIHRFDAVTEAYKTFFIKRNNLRVLEVPPCLAWLFVLMANCRNTEHCIFSNGTGKAFVAELLKLSATVGETWLPKLSTTTDPRTDWCGLPNPRHGVAT